MALSESTDQPETEPSEEINNSSFASKCHHQGTAGSPTSHRVRVSLGDTVGAHWHYIHMDARNAGLAVYHDVALAIGH